jgi:GNAT superfamily N-acetyltransferase
MKKIRFEELGSQRMFALPELQARADRNPLDEKRKQYRVWFGDDEVAFLTFDIFLPDELNVYEIFVAKKYRRQGVGSEVIRFAADLGRFMCKKRLSIWARPLSDQSQEDLIAWYVRRGLKPTEDDHERLLMDLSERD